MGVIGGLTTARKLQRQIYWRPEAELTERDQFQGAREARASPGLQRITHAAWDQLSHTLCDFQNLPCGPRPRQHVMGVVGSFTSA